MALEGNFQHKDPLAQLSKVPYDRLDRFQLSKVCKRLGFRHMEGEQHQTLVDLLYHRERGGEISRDRIMDTCREVLTDEERAKDAHNEHATPKSFFDPDPSATPKLQAGPSKEDIDFILGLAKIGHKELVIEAHKLGLKEMSSSNTRDEIVEAIRKHKGIG